MAKSILRKVEDAFEKYLSGLTIPGTPHIYTGIDNQIKEGPCVIVLAKSKKEDPIGSNNYLIHVIVTIKGLADPEPEYQSRDAFDAMTNAVEEVLTVGELPALLTEQTEDFTCLGCDGKTSDTDIDVMAWHEIHEIDVYCFGNDTES